MAMRTCQWLFAAVLMTLSAAAQRPSGHADGNLVRNSNFNDGLQDWQVRFPAPNEEKYARNHQWVKHVFTPDDGPGFSLEFKLTPEVAASEGVKAVTGLMELAEGVKYEFGADVQTRGPARKIVLEGREKLLESIVPKIYLEEATIYQAVNFLKQKSKELDPEGVGVNFSLELRPAAGNGEAARPAAAVADPFAGDDWGAFDDMMAPPVPTRATPTAPTPSRGGVANTITMNMDNIELGEAIKYICLGAGLHWRVESNAVVISDQPISDGADVQARGPAVKIFLEGYVRDPEQLETGNDQYPGFRRVYRKTIHVADTGGEWKVWRQTINPPDRAQPTHAVIKLYAYLKPGFVYFRNVVLQPAAK